MKQSDPIKIDGIYYRLNHDNKTAEATHNNKDKYTGSIVIPQSICFNGESYSVTTVGGCAFEFCLALISATIPNSVTTICDWSFYNCSSLKSITIPNSVTAIGKVAFYDCIGLNTITIPNSVTNIGEEAFAGCTGLKSVSIPETVTNIDSNAFSSCYNLSSIKCYAYEPSDCKGNAFNGVDISKCRLFVPKESIVKYKAAEGWKDFTHISAIEDMVEDD